MKTKVILSASLALLSWSLTSCMKFPDQTDANSQQPKEVITKSTKVALSGASGETVVGPYKIAFAIGALQSATSMTNQNTTVKPSQTGLLYGQ